MKNQYLAAGIGTPEQYTKIYSGFALEPFLNAKKDLDLRGKLGIMPADFVIGKIARLFKLKGHDDLFAIAPELVRQNPKIKFLLIGDGPWRERFEHLAKSQGMEKHFIFTGLVPRLKLLNIRESWMRWCIYRYGKVYRVRCRRRWLPPNRW